jgi:hypothetical protein
LVFTTANLWALAAAEGVVEAAQLSLLLKLPEQAVREVVADQAVKAVSLQVAQVAMVAMAVLALSG